MTFDEALRIKNNHSSTFMNGGTLYVTKIIPDLVDDKIKYLADFKTKDLSDEDAKLYSSNNEFKVEGLACVAFNVHHSPLL